MNLNYTKETAERVADTKRFYHDRKWGADWLELHDEVDRLDGIIDAKAEYERHLEAVNAKLAKRIAELEASRSELVEAAELLEEASLALAATPDPSRHTKNKWAARREQFNTALRRVTEETL